jgi:hypothetical protein
MRGDVEDDEPVDVVSGAFRWICQKCKHEFAITIPN